MKLVKKTMYYTFLCLALVFTSCSSDDDNNEGGDNGGNNGNGAAEFFTAKVDGVNFEASQDPATLIGATKTQQAGVSLFTAQGSTNEGNAINMSIFGYDGPGTYTTGDNLTNTNIIQYIEISPIGSWMSSLASAAVGGLQAGEIIITSDSDGVVEGTFSFEGYNGDNMTTKMITEGRFKVNVD